MSRASYSNSEPTKSSDSQAHREWLLEVFDSTKCKTEFRTKVSGMESEYDNQDALVISSASREVPDLADPTNLPSKRRIADEEQYERDFDMLLRKTPVSETLQNFLFDLSSLVVITQPNNIV